MLFDRQISKARCYIKIEAQGFDSGPLKKDVLLVMEADLEGPHANEFRQREQMWLWLML